MLRLAGIIRESIVDGPGIRFTVFAQGCPHRCDGCHNPQTWPFEGGFETSPEKIISEMKENPLLKGLTLSGGEPFCQAAEMSVLADKAHAEGYDVVAYTGFIFEELSAKAETDSSVADLLAATDILVDGRFVKEQMSYDLTFAGSKNQRIIDVRRSLKEKRIVSAEI
jgi:anaerobic ribonucleoside-triphosphate reductase activating protein